MRRTILLLCLLAPVAAHADSPIEWFLRPNGWGWSNGYHSNNNCVKVGWNCWAPIQNADWSQSYGEPWIPTCRDCGTYGRPTPASSEPEQVPTPAPRPKQPMMGPMMGPMMNGPMKAPPLPDQEAHRQPWMGLRY